MVLLVLFLLYCLFFGLLVLISVKILRHFNSTESRIKKVRKGIGLTGLATLPIAAFLFLIFMFGLGVEDHYDVKKHSLLWFLVMANRTITDFPLIEPIGKVKYNHIGGDSPNISSGWEVEYVSSNNMDSLLLEIKAYLSEEGFDIAAVNKLECGGWKSSSNSSTTKLYESFHSKEGCIGLLFRPESHGGTFVEALVLY